MTPLIAFFLGIAMPGLPELLIIGAVVLLLFGKRLPGVMRSLGQGIVEFKKGVSGIEDQSEQPAVPTNSESSSSSEKETEAAK